MEFDLANTAQVESRLDTVNTLTDAIDSEDPWVLATFGVRGPGEGLVWYPINVDDVGEEEEKKREEEKAGRRKGAVSGEVYSAFVFKTKGEKHRVVGTKKAAQVKPETAANGGKYVELMLPEPRLRQGTPFLLLFFIFNHFLILKFFNFNELMKQGWRRWAGWRRRGTSPGSSGGWWPTWRRRARTSWRRAGSTGSRCRRSSPTGRASGSLLSSTPNDNNVAATTTAMAQRWHAIRRSHAKT
jgi:hypothetical protein